MKAGTALGALAVFLVVACGGHGTATRPPAKATSAPPAATAPTPGQNTGVCHNFGTIAGQLSVALAGARSSPASVTAGERKGLLHAARLMDRWSNTAVVVGGNQFGTLPLDLRGASISVHLFATGYRGPSATSYLRGAESAVAKVARDCAGVTGG